MTHYFFFFQDLSDHVHGTATRVETILNAVPVIVIAALLVDAATWVKPAG